MRNRGHREEQRALGEKVAAAQARLTRLQLKAKLLGGQIARYKAQVAVLTRELKSPVERHATHVGGDPEIDRGTPSFSLAAQMHRRHSAHGVNGSVGFREPVFNLNDKTTAREFAIEHGVHVAEVLGRWHDPDAIEWDKLPDRFVIKSNRGGGGVNVYPLERDGAELSDHLVNRRTTQDEVTKLLWERHRPESCYFAEEFLIGQDSNALPNDIKVFCFYGKVGYVEVRTGDWSRAIDIKSRVRTFLPDGTELFHMRAMIDFESKLNRPTSFSRIRDANERLSLAIRRPMVRLDYFETSGRLVFGEVTPNPGHAPALTPEWDRHFGEMYEDAYVRLLNDLMAEGAIGLEYGDRVSEGKDPDGDVG